MSDARRLPRPPLARLGYSYGARLVRGDLEETRDLEARMLGLHVRGGHGGWGIARGLRVQLEPGARAVRVSAGTAFDCHGIVLEMPVESVLPAPASDPGASPLGAGVWDVVLERLPRTRAPGVTDATVAPGWRSVSPDDPSACGERARSGVPLARFRRSASGFLTPVTGRGAPRIRPASRPALRRGAVPGSGLDWIVGNYDLRAWVDTREAGFVGTPVYVVSLDGWSSQAGVAGPLLRIDHETPDGFQVRLLPAAPSPSPRTLDSLEPYTREIRLSWLGAEPHRGCASSAPTSLVPPLHVEPIDVWVPIYLYFGVDE